MLSQEADDTVLKIHQGCLDRKTVRKKYDDKFGEVMVRAHAQVGRPFRIIVAFKGLYKWYTICINTTTSLLIQLSLDTLTVLYGCLDTLFTVTH